MKVHYDLDNWGVISPVITIGTFDGVHLGHRKILLALKEESLRKGGEPVVFTFMPHPRMVLGHVVPGFHLINTLEEKIALMEEISIAHLVVYPFTPELAAMEACMFVERILVERCRIKTLVVGYNHHFGRNRAGGFEQVSECAARHGFSIVRVEAETLNGGKISSTEIRKALGNNDLERANSLLGAPYILMAKVGRGNGIGRKLGYPTANLVYDAANKLIPGDGVYAVKVSMDGRHFDGMMNIGFRPTFQEKEPGRTVEVHMFGLEEDIYGKILRVSIHKKIREEKRFENMEQLRLQLVNDHKDALRIL